MPEHTDNKFDKNKINEKSLLPYQKNYSSVSLQHKIVKYGKTIGVNIIYKVLQLWYVMQRPDVPAKTKAIIMGALGYLISPLDFIPDLTPVLGYNDDIAAILFTLVMVQQYIDDEVKAKAKQQIASLLGEEAVRDLE